MNGPTMLSYSSIALFRQCPSAWKARYIDKVKEAPGLAAKFGNDFDTQVAIELGIYPNDRDGKPVSAPAMTEKLKAAIDAYRAMPGSWLDTKPDQQLQTQVKVEVSKERWAEVAGRYGARADIPYPLIGYADFIRVVDGVRKQVCDLKTRERLEFKSEFNTQVGFYAAFEDCTEAFIHVVALGQKGKPRCAEHKILIPTNKSFVKHTLDWFAYYSWEIKRAVDDNNFEDLPREAGYYCSWCPMKQECPVARVQA